MKNNYRSDLLKELNQEGMSQKDAEELLQTAFSLSKLSTIRRSYEFKKIKAEIISSQKIRGRFFFGFPRILIPALAVLILLFGTSSIVLAQKSLPGETLYPVKRVTEDVIVTFNPVFKEVVFKRRVEENKVIIEKKKVSDEQHRLEEDKKEEEKSEKTSIIEAQKKTETKKESESLEKEIEKENKKEKVKNNNVKGEQTERQNSDKENSNENKNKEDDKGEDKTDNSQQKD